MGCWYRHVGEIKAVCLCLCIDMCMCVHVCMCVDVCIITYRPMSVYYSLHLWPAMMNSLMYMGCVMCVICHMSYVMCHVYVYVYV